MFSERLLLLLSIYFLTLLKRKCFEPDNSATQLEMDVPLRQTPPSVQPPISNSGSSGRPIFHGGTVGRSEAELLPSKQAPHFFPL